jgi:hypothetical protein
MFAKPVSSIHSRWHNLAKQKKEKERKEGVAEIVVLRV